MRHPCARALRTKRESRAPQVEERRPHRKVLQRRALRSDTYEERAVSTLRPPSSRRLVAGCDVCARRVQSDRWLGSSFPPAGRASAEDKLLRLISDKAFEHSTTRGAMREVRGRRAGRGRGGAMGAWR
jgi:hypothetical protein